MELGLILRVSWISFLLFGTAVCHPVVKTGQLGSAAQLGSLRGVGVSAGKVVVGSDLVYPVFEQPAGGTWYYLNSQLQSRPFPDLNAWGTADVPLGVIAPAPAFPASYIVQSSSGYQRAADSLAHTKYTDEIFDNLPFPVAQQQQHVGYVKGLKVY